MSGVWGGDVLSPPTVVVYCCDCVGWRIVSGGGDHDIKLWDIESGHVTNTLSGHTQEVVRYISVSCYKLIGISPTLVSRLAKYGHFCRTLLFCREYLEVLILVY